MIVQEQKRYGTAADGHRKKLIGRHPISSATGSIEGPAEVKSLLGNENPVRRAESRFNEHPLSNTLPPRSPATLGLTRTQMERPSLGARCTESSSGLDPVHLIVRTQLLRASLSNRLDRLAAQANELSAVTGR